MSLVGSPMVLCENMYNYSINKRNYGLNPEKGRTDDNLKENFTTRYSFCNRFSCFEGVKMVKNACMFFLTSAKQGENICYIVGFKRCMFLHRGKIYAIFRVLKVYIFA